MEASKKWKQVKIDAYFQGFDVYRVPGKYFILCDWSIDVVAMFDDTEYGYTKAFAWMKEQKPPQEKRNAQ